MQISHQKQVYNTNSIDKIALPYQKTLSQTTVYNTISKIRMKAFQLDDMTPLWYGAASCTHFQCTFTA